MSTTKTHVSLAASGRLLSFTIGDLHEQLVYFTAKKHFLT